MPAELRRYVQLEYASVFLLILICCLEGVALLVAIAVVFYFYVQLRDQTQANALIATAKTDLESALERSKATASDQLSSASWYRALFTDTNDMILVHEIDPSGLPGRFIEANRTACERLEMSRDDLVRKTPLDIEHVETPVAALGYTRSDMVTMSEEAVDKRMSDFIARPARNQMTKLLETGEASYERTYTSGTGKLIPVEVSGRILELAGKPVVMCTVIDATVRKEAERALMESEQQFQDFFAHSPIGVVLYDKERSLRNVNQSCLRMFGVPDMEQFRRLNLFDNPFIPDDARALLKRGETVRYEMCVNFEEVLRKGLFITTKTSGEAYFDVMINNMTHDSNFKPRGYFAQVQDITERRFAEAELHANEQHLRQAEKMEAIGSLAGGIAHDFNNILTPILGYAELTLRTNGDNKAVQKCMKGIIKASSRAKELVSQILTYCRRSDGEEESYQPTIITPIIKEVIALQSKSLPPEVEIVRVLKADDDTVLADATKIHQIVMNLCTNAGHAMRGRDDCRIEVRTSNFVHERRARNSKYSDLAFGQYIEISVSDTGSGMDAETADKVFQPFFTTKAKGEGTGMGLSVVDGIVRSFNGAITLETELGAGTTFYIALPTMEKMATDDGDEPSMTELPMGDESILLVDDEPDILEMEVAMLTSLGYRTTAASTGKEALALYEADPDAYDLILTDQVMPEMKGSELAEILLTITPELPLVFCTGFSEDFSREDASALGAVGFLEKPIEIADLAESIRRAIDDGPSTPTNGISSAHIPRTPQIPADS